MHNGEQPNTGAQQGGTQCGDARPRLARTGSEADDRRISSQVEEAFEDLRHDIHTYRVRRHIHLCVSAVLWGTLLALVIVNPVNFFWAFTPIVVLQAMLTIATTYRFHSLRPLIDVANPRAVNGLALACWKGDRVTQHAAAAALKRMLPALRAEDAIQITPDGMNALLGLLFRCGSDEELSIAILKALEQVGDARAVPPVERLIAEIERLHTATVQQGVGNGYGSWRVVRMMHLQDRSPLQSILEAARECLPYLKTREEHDRAKHRLLRPVTEPAESAPYLLRPAGAGIHAQPESLLRPLAPADEEEQSGP